MTQTPIAHSPVHHLVEIHEPNWGRIGDCPVALDFGNLEAERSAAAELALGDVSALSKLGVKGPAAATWLKEQGLDVPEEYCATTQLAGGGMIARIAGDEFILESGPDVQTIRALGDKLGLAQGQAYRLERQEATFILSGQRSGEVLAQTCGINLAEAAPRRLIMTRMAVATAMIIPEPIDSLPVYRLWFDYTFAEYMWETLLEIAGELGGKVVGARCFYPELH